jgi:hypothetical protein
MSSGGVASSPDELHAVIASVEIRQIPKTTPRNLVFIGPLCLRATLSVTFALGTQLQRGSAMVTLEVG